MVVGGIRRRDNQCWGGIPKCVRTLVLGMGLKALLKDVRVPFSVIFAALR